MVRVVRQAPPGLRRELLCVRVRPRGASIIAVARRASGETAVREFFRRHGLPAETEVKTIYRYNKVVAQLAREIGHAVPQQLAGVAVGREIYHEAIDCPRALIEVGPQGATPRANVTWAKEEIARYGADRVAYRYFIEGTIK